MPGLPRERITLGDQGMTVFRVGKPVLVQRRGPLGLVFLGI